jgi:hypothetical protein
MIFIMITKHLIYLFIHSLYTYILGLLKCTQPSFGLDLQLMIYYECAHFENILIRIS